jgi:hypothetical protein
VLPASERVNTKAVAQPRNYLAIVPVSPRHSLGAAVRSLGDRSVFTEFVHHRSLQSAFGCLQQATQQAFAHTPLQLARPPHGRLEMPQSPGRTLRAYMTHGYHGERTELKEESWRT